MRTLLPALLLVTMVLAPSCREPTRRQGALLSECQFNDECASPLLCAARRCRAECRTDRDCTNGWRCLSSGQPGRSVCYAQDDYGSACVYSADCRASWVCADRECRQQCRADYDCRLIRPGLTCLRALGVCSAHPSLTDAGTLPDVDLNDPDGAAGPVPVDVPRADVAVDAPAVDAPAVDAPAVDAPTVTDVALDAGPFPTCALRVRAGACTPGPGCGVAAVGIGIGARCAVLRDGSVRCWGSGSGGVLGNGTTTSCPVPGLVSGLSDATEVGVGFAFACARRRDGMGIQCWGQSNVGEVGNGTSMGATTLVPTAISAADNTLYVGNGHSCTLGAGGAASCWGTNADGQYGNGTLGGAGIFNYFTTPRPVSLPVRTLALGVSHSCGVGLDGAARCWGSGEGLGDGAMTASASPVLVAGLSAVEQVVVGQGASCARLADGTVRCWGLNNNGQLGDGSMTTRPTPVTPAVTDVAELAMGGFTSCARRSDGSVWCWGARESAGMGVGPMGVLTPTAVPGLRGVTRLYGGLAGFCALRGSDADLVCWGVAAGSGAIGISPTPEAVRW